MMIIIIIIIIIICFMQGIYTDIPATKHASRQYSVAAILQLLLVVLIKLFLMSSLLHFYISTFRSVCAVPNMAVFCSSSIFFLLILLLLLLLLLLLTQFPLKFKTKCCGYKSSVFPCRDPKPGSSSP